MKTKSVWSSVNLWDSEVRWGSHSRTDRPDKRRSIWLSCSCIRWSKCFCSSTPWCETCCCNPVTELLTSACCCSCLTWFAWTVDSSLFMRASMVEIRSSSASVSLCSPAVAMVESLFSRERLTLFSIWLARASWLGWGSQVRATLLGGCQFPHGSEPLFCSQGSTLASVINFWRVRAAIVLAEPWTSTFSTCPGLDLLGAGEMRMSAWSSWYTSYSGAAEAWISQSIPLWSAVLPLGCNGLAGQAQSAKSFASDCFVAPYGKGPAM